MELRQAMRTTPSTRQFTDDDLPDDVLYDILEHARFAPNGGNRQGWRVIVVRDAETKQRIHELYDLGMREYVGHLRAGLVPFVASEAHWRNPPDGPLQPAIDLAEARGEGLGGDRATIPMDNSYIARVPVLLILLVDLASISAVDTGLGRIGLTAGGSIFPLAHNILMAARDVGYGGHVTSVLARQEPALRKLLDIPDEFALGTMLPMGKPVREIKKLRRAAVEDFTTVGSFTGPSFGPPD
jgi:nitroreductase